MTLDEQLAILEQDFPKAQALIAQAVAQGHRIEGALAVCRSLIQARDANPVAEPTE